MNEINYGEVFGVDTGANESAPAQQTDDTAEAEVESTETDAGEKETEPAEQSESKQTPEENRKFAAARRKAEQERDAAIAQARTAAQRALDESIRGLGIENPYTGRPITTKAEYDAWKRAEAQEKQQNIAEAAGMSQQEFGSFVENLPQVREYRQAAEAARQQQQKMVLEEQIGQIAKLDPSIKGVEDLLKRPEYPQIYNYVKKGISIEEAFKLANYDKLTSSAGNAARQAALNAANSKEHLAPTSQRGAGSVPVPADVKAQYKLLNPDATDAEIQEHYNRFHKK